MKATLMLEDGKSFSAEALGQGERIGEVIMNTAVVGYQEMMTDPANAGKILVLTYPLIGNYGCAPKFNLSKNVWLAGLVIKEKTRVFSNWQAKVSFDDFIQGHHLLTLNGVDTRTLAVHLRQKGQMLGIISTTCLEPKELREKIQARRRNAPLSVLPKISVPKITAVSKPKGKNRKIALLDLGVTQDILRQMEILGLGVTLVPYNIKAEEILGLKPDGLVISGGPEEDPGLKEVAQNIKPLLGKVPILGIATGHQVLGLALGAKISKMKLGHRGVNYPIYHPRSYKAEITVQNHGCAVDADSLSKIKEVNITGYNLNDRTIEEMESKKMKLMGVQYSLASPGFDEVNPVFNRFIKLIKES